MAISGRLEQDKDKDRRQALTWNYYFGHMTSNQYNVRAKSGASLHRLGAEVNVRLEK